METSEKAAGNLKKQVRRPSRSGAAPTEPKLPSSAGRSATEGMNVDQPGGDPAQPGLKSLMLRAVIHTDPAGGFWAEVPALKGCITEADTVDELIDRLRDAASAWLAIASELNPPEPDPKAMFLEIPL